MEIMPFHLNVVRCQQKMSGVFFIETQCSDIEFLKNWDGIVERDEWYGRVYPPTLRVSYVPIRFW